MLPLITDILSIEEYRGFDSAVYCQVENSQYEFYREFGLELEKSYYGAVPRFAFIWAFRHRILKAEMSETMKGWVSSLVEGLVDRGLVVGKERMFLSGRNKVKLQIWQFLMAIEPDVIVSSLGAQKTHELLLKLIEGLNLNIINEARYYFELFLMRLLTNKTGFRHK